MTGALPKRAGGPCVKARNLAAGTTGATLKEVLEQWGVTGIGEVVISEGRSGPMAIMRFKTEAEAELMMLANGVEVEGMAMHLEYLPAAPAVPRGVFGQGRPDAPRKAPAPSNLMKVTGVKKGSKNNELVTFLRSYGVLGLAEVIISADIGLVRFHTAQNVEAAIAKANGTSFKDEKLALRAIGPAEWRELEAAGSEDAEGEEWGDEQAGYDWGMREGAWAYQAGRSWSGAGSLGGAGGASRHGPAGYSWQGDLEAVARPPWMHEEHVVQVSNLPPGFTSARLRKLFYSIGIDSLTGTWVASGSSVGLVAFESAREAAEALQANGMAVEGSRIAVALESWEEASHPQQPPQPGSAGLGGQKQPRGILPASGLRGQQGATSGGTIRARTWGHQDAGGGGSSGSGGRAQAPRTADADDSAIPAAFRGQAAARKSVARGSEVDSRGAWSESRGNAGSCWGAGPQGSDYLDAGPKGGLPPGWSRPDWGGGWGAVPSGGASWGKRSTPYRAALRFRDNSSA